MVKSERTVKRKDNTVVDELLNPEGNSGVDWFTKLAKVERAKGFRREGQKARKRKPMIQRTPTHTALFSADDAIEAGLPVIKPDPMKKQWQLIWRLWAKYFALGSRLYQGIYENARVSQIGAYED